MMDEQLKEMEFRIFFALLVVQEIKIHHSNLVRIIVINVESLCCLKFRD